MEKENVVVSNFFHYCSTIASIKILLLNISINNIFSCSMLFIQFPILLLASPYGKTKRIRWTEDEKKAALEAFAQHVDNGTLPSLKEIQLMKKKYTVLTRRTSPQIKTWLHNQQKNERFSNL